MPRLLGLRNIVCSKDDWFYLVFYDIDKEQLTENEIEDIGLLMRRSNISYLIYKTKHGYHIIGLTPVNCIIWAYVFNSLKHYFKSYYSGNVIRLSRKENEIQTLIKKELELGEIIPNLYNLFASRFNYEKMPWTRETTKYLLVFEKYRINVSDA